MMSSRLNTGTMAPTSDVDFGYAPMQPSYVGSFEPAGMVMPGDRPPLLQHHLYDSLDFAAAAAGFPFQEPSLFSGSAPNSSNNLQQQQTFSPQITMPMVPTSSMQPPMMTLPGVPTAGAAADMYPFGGGGGGFLKREDGPFADVAGGGGRIGLNLGRRTYFSPADVLAVDRLLMRSRFGGGGAMGVLGLGLGAAHHHQPPRCQAEGCKADLSAAKHYHRRHKVCEYHAKAAAVTAAGKQQRFCQQCSRFHVLSEFDEAKRSCRKRLTEHNRRRRKPAGAQAKDSPPPSKKAEASMTSSYTSDHKNNKSTAISPNSSGFSCLLEVDNGQSSNATTAPTTLSLAAPPPPHDSDGALDTMLMQRHVVQGRGDEQQQQQHFMMTSLVQSHHQGNSRSGNILSCSSASDHQNDSSCCNGGSNGNGNGNSMQHFFEVDFM